MVPVLKSAPIRIPVGVVAVTEVPIPLKFSVTAVPNAAREIVEASVEYPLLTEDQSDTPEAFTARIR